MGVSDFASAEVKQITANEVQVPILPGLVIDFRKFNQKTIDHFSNTVE